MCVDLELCVCVCVCMCVCVSVCVRSRSTVFIYTGRKEGRKETKDPLGIYIWVTGLNKRVYKPPEIKNGGLLAKT